MYNAQGNQQMYNAQGSPQVFTPNGTAKPYKTPPLSTEMFSVQGNTISIEKFNAEGPAFISEDAKKNYWNERSVHGLPVGATEWENKGNEKYAWISNITSSYVPNDVVLPPNEVQNAPQVVGHTSPLNFRGATEREIMALEDPGFIPVPGGRENNKGCYYTTNGEIICK